MNLQGWDISFGDANHILSLLRVTPDHCWPFLRKKYNLLKTKDNRYAANMFILETKDKTKGFEFNLAADDQAIKDRAVSKAKWAKRAIRVLNNEQKAYDELINQISSLNIPAPNAKSIRGALNRFKSEKWWRRKLRISHSRSMETFARNIGMVNSRNQHYVSNATFFRRRTQRANNRALLESFEMINELGEIFSLDELVDKSVSNPEIRRNELMCRIAGNEISAKENGLVADFYTFTVPGRMHSHYGSSGDAIASYDGTTSKSAQKELQGMWSRIRAALKRVNLNIHGVRVTEPHKDGTPHWHMLVFMKKEERKAIRKILKHYALQLDPNEPGAEKHRFKIEAINPSKGTATGYIAKYISKNIDGHMLEDDLFEGSAVETAKRVEAWSSTWGIRQFQFFGNPPVTIWRELRRLKNSKDPIINEAIEAADNNNWALYMVIMGGACATKAMQPIWLLMCHTDKLNEYEEPILAFAIGVESSGDHEISREHEWEKRLKPANSSENSQVSDCGHLEFCQ